MNAIADTAILNFAIGRFDKAEIIGPRISCQRCDQTDIRSFRRLDRTDTPVMSRMHVPNFESGPLPSQATWTERRQAPLVSDLGKRVGLVHELRKLARAEKFLERRGNGLRSEEHTSELQSQ